MKKTFARTLRANMTDAELKLWRHLRDRQIKGCKFRRQHVIGRFIVDFVCIQSKLVVEIDGGQHAEMVDADQKRTAWLNQQGYEVLRFWNNEVLGEISAVLEVIADRLGSPPS